MQAGLWRYRIIYMRAIRLGWPAGCAKKMEGSTAANVEPSTFRITCCCLKFLFCALCYFFFFFAGFFFAAFFFAAFFFLAIICYLHMAHKNQFNYNGGVLVTAVNQFVKEADKRSYSFYRPNN